MFIYVKTDASFWYSKQLAGISVIISLGDFSITESKVVEAESVTIAEAKAVLYATELVNKLWLTDDDTVVIYNDNDGLIDMLTERETRSKGRNMAIIQQLYKIQLVHNISYHKISRNENVDADLAAKQIIKALYSPSV